MVNHLSQNPTEIGQYVLSEDPNQRWSAARAIQVAQVPMGGELIQLLNDPEPTIVQEARAGLVAMSGNRLDRGPAEDAGPEQVQEAVAGWRTWWVQQSPNSSFNRVSRQSNEELRQTLGSEDPEERWAAVVTVHNRRLPYFEELIELLGDSDELVRRGSR